MMPVAILDVDRGPAEFEIRQQVKHVAFFLSVDPTASVKEYQRGMGTGPIFRKIKIEFQLEIACLA